jgi:hypothetical protein
MVLTKIDLKEIGKLIKESEKKLSVKIEQEIGNLARMSASEFDRVHDEMENLNKNQLVHSFKLSEMVHKADYFQLEERVGRLEKKVGIAKK